MKTKFILFATSLALSGLLYAEEAALTAEQQNLINETYGSAQSNPLQSIRNADGLTPEQKTQLESTYQQSNANAPGACKTILCIAGIMLGGSGGGACSSAIQNYFNILKFKDGKFSPGRTASARGSFLGGCPSPANKANASMINSSYGRMFANPF